MIVCGKLKHQQEQLSNGQKRINVLRLLILIPEIFKNLIGIASCYDPIGNFQIINYLHGRLALQANGSIGTFTNVIMCIMCYDIYLLFKRSQNMRRKKKPGGINLGRYIEVVSVIIAALMVVVELTVCYYALLGKLGANSVVVSAAYNALTSIVVAVFLSVVRR